MVKENHNKNKNIKTVQEVSKEWLSTNYMNHKASTILKYQTIIDCHITPFIGDMNICEVNELVVYEFLAQKSNYGNTKNKNGLSASYVKLIAIVLNAIINYSADMQYRTQLKKSIVKPSPQKKEIMLLDIHSQIRLEIFLKDNISPTGIGILLAMHAGLRIGEVCALKWENIDFNTKMIQIRNTITRIKNTDTNTNNKTILVIGTPKTDSSYRDIPINSKLIHYLTLAKKISKSDYVVSDKDSFVSPRTFEYRYHKILRQCGVEELNFHALRHTFATRCIELGVDVKTLSELLGHSNVNITLNTYVHSSMEQKRNQIEKLVSIGNLE